MLDSLSHFHNWMPTRRIFLVLMLLVTLGCTKSDMPIKKQVANTTESKSVQRLCEIVADVMGMDVKNLNGNTSLADLKVDELDMVEIVMDLEEEFDVTISDDAVSELTGSEKWSSPASLTIEKLMGLVKK